MLKIEEYVANLKESKALSQDGLRIDTQQSYLSVDNTQFQNPIYRMAPLEHFQSVTENKYSNIFSSYISSPKNDEIQQTKQKTPKKRTFSFAESQIQKQDSVCNVSAEFGQKPYINIQQGKYVQTKQIPYYLETPKRNSKQLQDSLQVLNSSVPQSQQSSPQKKNIKIQKNYSINQSFDPKQKQTQTTNYTINDKNELDQIFKECQSNFEKNKARTTKEYVACLIF